MLLLETIWFFLPAFGANLCPGLAQNFNLPFSHTPVSGKWLGDNKTVAAYYAGPIGALVVIYAQKFVGLSSGLLDYSRSDLWLIGLLFGLGASLGDQIKSFFKRRLGIVPGARWWPFDQLDFMVGALLFVSPVVGWIGWSKVFVLTLVVLLVHPVGNRIGYHLGTRKVPW